MHSIHLSTSLQTFDACQIIIMIRDLCKAETEHLPLRVKPARTLRGFLIIRGLKYINYTGSRLIRSCVAGRALR